MRYHEIRTIFLIFKLLHFLKILKSFDSHLEVCDYNLDFFFLVLSLLRDILCGEFLPELLAEMDFKSTTDKVGFSSGPAKFSGRVGTRF